MCGIAGILTTRSDLDLRPILDRMVVALRHRGPDDEGTQDVTLPGGYRLGLAHTRLAILDLSAAGHQPMQEPATGSWIVYNGEIYNHADVRREVSDFAFRSGSDTETILAGWARKGERLLPSLRGMFAFGLYDGRRRKFLLVRDRLGVKPLYATRVAPDCWLFASEVRALLASGLLERKLDPMGVESYLAHGAVCAPRTFLAGVESLLPAEWWEFDLSVGGPIPEPRRTRYWRPPFQAAGAPSPTYLEAVSRVREVLVEAATLRMVSDVPVAVFLSGGIDSSSIVSSLTAQGRSVQTFSIVFDESKYDESAYSRAVARWFGTAHTAVRLRPQRVLEQFDKALAAYDQPSVDGVNTFFISQATAEAGIKVALSGVGGDELFAGYPSFRMTARLESPATRFAARLLHNLLQVVAPRSARTVKLGMLLSRWPSRVGRYTAWRQVMLPGRRRALFGCGAGPEDALPPAVHRELEEQVRDLDAVNAHSLLELSLYLANMLLRDTDQMSMAHGLELREPLLDHVLVETVAGLSGALKLAPGKHAVTKRLLVDALPRRLPDATTRRKKMGFTFPWDRWLRHELKPLVGSVFTEEDETIKGIGFRPEAVNGMWQQFLEKRAGVRSADVLCILHLLCWARRHRLTL